MPRRRGASHAIGWVFSSGARGSTESGRLRGRSVHSPHMAAATRHQAYHRHLTAALLWAEGDRQGAGTLRTRPAPYMMAEGHMRRGYSGHMRRAALFSLRRLLQSTGATLFLRGRGSMGRPPPWADRPHGQTAPMGSARARPLRLLRVRLAALGGPRTPQGQEVGLLAVPAKGVIASGARASRLQSRRFHCLGRFHCF